MQPGSIESPERQVLWKSINEVPATWRYLHGGRLSVDQCNEIYKDLAPRMDNNFAMARWEFEKTHTMEGNVWVEGGESA
jgi:hypothetical protein